MPLVGLHELHAALGRDQRLMGIDPGSKTIGLALSDTRRVLASPFGSLKRGKLKAAAAEIAAIARKEDVGGLVVGLPLSMDGSLGPAAQAARDWALALSEATGLPAAMQDERRLRLGRRNGVNFLFVDSLEGGLQLVALEGKRRSFILLENRAPRAPDSLHPPGLGVKRSPMTGQLCFRPPSYAFPCLSGTQRHGASA